MVISLGFLGSLEYSTRFHLANLLTQDLTQEEEEEEDVSKQPPPLTPRSDKDYDSKEEEEEELTLANFGRMTWSQAAAKKKETKKKAARKKAPTKKKATASKPEPKKATPPPCRKTSVVANPYKRKSNAKSKATPVLISQRSTKTNTPSSLKVNAVSPESLADGFTLWVQTETRLTKVSQEYESGSQPRMARHTTSNKAMTAASNHTLLIVE